MGTGRLGDSGPGQAGTGEPALAPGAPPQPWQQRVPEAGGPPDSGGQWRGFCALQAGLPRCPRGGPCQYQRAACGGCFSEIRGRQGGEAHRLAPALGPPVPCCPGGYESNFRLWLKKSSLIMEEERLFLFSVGGRFTSLREGISKHR